MLTEHFHNTQKDTGHYSNDLRYVLSLQNTIAAFEEIKTWEGYAKTPLHSLDSLASDIGVKNIYYKESVEKAIRSIPVKENDIILITGSLYLAGEVLNLN